ncbi:MAG: hypothetical protein IT430_20315 [Phycisphaerales bacterium]|nr:hypothetical protein [Phycisphaerales bacterium]
MYGQGGSSAECRDGATLAERLAAVLPDAVEPEPVAHRFGRIGAWLSRYRALLAPLLVVAAIACGVYALSRVGGLSFSFDSIRASTGAKWSAAYATEARAAKAAAGGWSSMPSQPVYREFDPDPTLDPATLDFGRSPDMDLETSIDGVYARRDEAFDPPLYWTHRLHVFSTVDSAYQFHPAPMVEGGPLGPAPQRGKAYRADVQVVFRSTQPVPLPAPAPGSIIVECRTSPDVDITFAQDDGDGLYVSSNYRGKVRLRYTIIAPPDYAFAALPEVPFEPSAAPLPPNVAADAQQVVAAIGDLPAPTYAGTVRRLQSYFAGFTVGPIDRTRMQRNEFLTVALQRRGVCRHRSRAFFVVANAVGVETRLVENQRHSFCEVRLPDGSWRRIEFRLEGAEGAPGIGGGAGYVPRYFPLSSLVPIIGLSIVAVLLLALIGSRRRADVAAHFVHASVPLDRSLDRAWRDRRSGVSWEVTADLVRLVRITLIDRLDLRPQPPHGLRAACKRRRIPQGVQERMIHVMELDLRSLHARTDPAVLDDCYWDSLRIMHHLERMGDIERPTCSDS